MAVSAVCLPGVEASREAPAAAPACRRERVWFGPVTILLFVAGMFTIAFPGVIRGTESFFYRDYGIFGYPIAHYFHESFWKGELPLWNPYNDCGLPFMAQWNTMVFYPGSLIYLVFPLPWSLNLFSLVHLVFAAGAMYALAHAWTGNRFAASVAALAYAWNGFTLHALMWPHIIAALSFAPLIILFGVKAAKSGGRNIVWAALAGGMQMLTGAVEVILLTWCIAACFVGLGAWLSPGERIGQLRRFVLIVLLTSGIAAVQLLPALDLIAHSNRDSKFADSIWAMPLWGAANFFVPLFGCTPSRIGVFSQQSQQWTSSYYMGVLVVVLAAAAWRGGTRPKLLAGLCVAAVVLALGEAAGVYGLVKKAVPLLGFIRYPIKFVILAIIVLPLLASFGVSTQAAADRPAARKGLLCWIGLGAASVIVALVVASWLVSVQGASAKVTTTNGVARLGFLLAGIAAIWGATRAATVPAKIGCQFLVLGVMGADVLTHMPRQNPIVSNSAYFGVSLPMTEPPKLGKGRAMVAPKMYALMQGAINPDPLLLYLGFRQQQVGNCNLLHDVPKVNGFFPLYLREAKELQDKVYATSNAPAPLMDFMGVRQLSDAETLFVWHPRTNALPLVTAGQQPAFVSATGSLGSVCSSTFDPSRTVYIDSSHADAARQLGMKGEPGRARAEEIKFRAHEITFNVEADAPSVAVIAQSFHRGWKATVDGRPAPVWKANHAFQAIPIPQGASKVRVAYTEPMLVTGALGTGLTLLICAWMWRRSEALGTSPS